MDEIKAIETTYNGVLFRSRLEARWAVLFDQLGIKWFYEHEGYQTPTGNYVPDFWLPDVYMRTKENKGVLFEVKPENYNDYMHPQLEYVASELRVSAILAVGFEYETGGWDELLEIAPMWDNSMIIYQCDCGKTKFDFSNYHDCPFCKKEDYNGNYLRISKAYNHAVKYRFW